MPEIGEVARIVHYLRKHLVGRTISSCTSFDDPIVYGKVGTSADAFKAAVSGRRVTGADQQGKYFYITFDRPPHAVLHLGMTGWIKFDSEDTAYYKQAKEKKNEEEWPPRFMKFLLHCDAQSGKDPLEVAFVDPRRLARIRLVDCEAAEIRQHSPLKENGPDPVRDKDIVTVEWLTELLGRKKVPVKALLLDQGNISGVGNWVADEVLYQARIHPEQYSNTFNQSQIKSLHDSLIGVCTTACELLADSARFPETWLMKYRWDKGKKDSNTLPSGEKIVHLTVGGRTSAIVPSVQKKTAAVAGDIDSADDEKPAKGRKRKSKAAEEAEVEDEEAVATEQPSAKKAGHRGAKAATNGAEAEIETQTPRSKRAGRHAGEATPNGVKVEEGNEGGEDVGTQKPARKTATPKKAEKQATPGSRRSTRTKT